MTAKWSDKDTAGLTDAERKELKPFIDAMDDAERRQDVGELFRAKGRFDIELRKLRAATLGRELKGWNDVGC